MNYSQNTTNTSFYHRYKKIVWTCLGIILVFALWSILALFYHSVAIPGPIATFKQLGVLILSERLYIDIVATMGRLFISFTISFLIGSILGLLSGLFNWLYDLLHPLIITLRTLPTAAVILIFVTLVSSTKAPYYIVFLVVFPIAYESMAKGIKNIPNEFNLALSLEGSKKMRSITHIRIPLAGPYIGLGILQSLGLGMKVEIMSEILSGNMNLHGLGIAIKVFVRDVDMVNVFAYSVVAIILTGLIELGIYFIKKKITK